MRMYVSCDDFFNADFFSLNLSINVIVFNKYHLIMESVLANEEFLIRAPEEIVEKEHQKMGELTDELQKVTANLEMLQ